MKHWLYLFVLALACDGGLAVLCGFTLSATGTAAAAEATLNPVEGDTDVEPGDQITFTLVLEPKQNCVWEVFPLGRQKDVRRITQGEARTSVLNFSTGKPPGGDWSKPWSFTVANYLFLGESPDEEPIVTYKIVNVRIHGPQPPPEPEPEPKPDPTPVPPIPGVGLRVMIVEETAERATLPAAQLAALTSTKIRGYLNSKCARSADGKHVEWRQWDDDFTAEDLANETQLWRDAYAKAKSDAQGKCPWIVISNGKTGVSVELPKTEAATLELLQKYGGT